MRVYAVMVCFDGTEKLSQEAYSSLEAAHRFIKSRVPEPERLSMMKFRDAEGREYIIHNLLVIEPKEKRQFWAVNTKFFDSGRVKVNVYPVFAEEKPEGGSQENKTCDEYIDYFDTQEEASAWAEQARNA